MTSPGKRPGGRPPKLTYTMLHRIDTWFADRKRFKYRKLPISAMCRILQVSRNTIYDAAMRRNAYRGCPRG